MEYFNIKGLLNEVPDEQTCMVIGKRASGKTYAITQYSLYRRYSTARFPHKPREFKKLKCHYLVAENWKPVPIVRGIGRGRNNGVSYSCGVAQMYHIEPHNIRAALWKWCRPLHKLRLAT